MIFRLLRGGSYGDVTRDLRTSGRGGNLPANRSWYVGFRLIVRRQA